MIKDFNNNQITGNEIGPLEVGEDLMVICEVAGGTTDRVILIEVETREMINI